MVLIIMLDASFMQSVSAVIRLIHFILIKFIGGGLQFYFNNII